MKRAAKYIGIILAIFRRDVLRIIKNPLALVVLLGACLLPSAYAWYCIAANWDPYQNASSIRVAVANTDAGADTQITGHLDVGSQVVAQLHDNHELGWAFYENPEAAINSVYSGESFAAIIIPKNFSESFASVFDGKFVHPEIAYYVNEKVSSVAPKVTDAGATGVEKKINQAFVEEVTKTVMDITQKFGDYAQGKADSAQSDLMKGVHEADGAIDNTKEMLGGLVPTLENTSKATEDAESTLNGLQNSVPEIVGSIDEAKQHLESARKTVNEYGNKIAENLTSASVSIGTAASVATSELAKVHGSVQVVQSDVSEALAEAKGVVSANAGIIDELKKQQLPSQVQAILGRLEQANGRLNGDINALENANSAINNTLSGMDEAFNSINKQAQDGAENIRNSAHTFQSEVLPKITESLDSSSNALGQLSGVVSAVKPTLDHSVNILNELAEVLATAKESVEQGTQTLNDIEANLDTTITDLDALRSSAATKSLATFLGLNPNDISEFMAQPVQLKSQYVFPVSNYGSGVTPFYTNLALWVAGFILMALVKLRVSPEGLPKFTRTQAYFGRWLFYVCVGLIQALICCTGDLIIGIQCESPVAFIGAGLLTVFVDVNLLYALAYAFRHVGKAVAVILLIMQIPGSSGMYPVEMMPAFFQIINPLLPFTYSINAMREAIGGFYGLYYLWDMLSLAFIFLPVGLFIGLFFGRYAFNLNVMIDSKLERTGIFASEHVPEGMQRFRRSSLINALLDTKAYRKRLLARAAKFRSNYPKLRKLGWALVVIQPVAMFVVMVLVQADVDVKLVLLAFMVLGIIFVDMYLIVLAYVRADLDYQVKLADLDDEELASMAKQNLLSANRSGGQS